MQDPYPHPEIEAVPLTEVLHALSDPLRLRILATLAADGERGWGAFAAGVSPSTLSHHMKVLRQAGLVRHRREGTRCVVTLRDEIGARFPGLLDTVLALEAQAEPAS
ncbi:transcriptional regulator [Pseudoroseomonas rhizosphaerae]|uniref:Transcriptional regulator n=1 Tax=Teichococcus rhizosphaerae TaxID=1335062 RepID=A0A2C7A966_9PROT|nr:metalloregulator ArsR/SmtB family transcription factor [Pseudoroseomonas rhizosphaerae]PHK94173.1 transcriptional regulator [Pseudoroseomonas rhizosphaerae]